MIYIIILKRICQAKNHIISATDMSITNTPIPIPMTMPNRKACPSGSIDGRNFIQLYPYPSLHTLYTTLSRDCQVFFLFFLWLATVGHVEKGLDSGIDSGYPDISAWFEQ